MKVCKPLKKTIAVMLILVFPVTIAPPAGATAAGKPDPDPIPVVLVHGFMPAAETWQLPPRRGGLYAALIAAGYTPGTTLFWLSASPWRDPVVSARKELVPLLAKIASHTGAPVVDVIAHANGVLDIQHLLWLLDTDPGLAASLPRIRQIIAIAPMWEGHEAAHLIRLATFKEQVLSWHRQRSLPRNTNAFDGEVALPPFVGETSYVTARAYEAYQPLYHQFLRTAWFFNDQAQRPTPAFWEWLALSYPEHYRQWLTGKPPLDGNGARADNHWPVGTDLSTFAYEIAAFEAAKFAYRSLQPVKDLLLDEWQSDIQFTGDWQQTLVRFLTQRIWHVLKNKTPVWLEQIQDRGIRLLVERLLAVDPLHTALRRMVPRTYTEPVSAPAPRVANVWNDTVSLPHGPGARPDGPRIVEIRGRLTGPLAIVLGGQDTRGTSTVKATDLDDQAIIVSGWWGVDDRQILGSKKLHQHVINALQWHRQAQPLSNTSTKSARYRLEPQLPQYFRVEEGSGSTSLAQVTVAVPLDAPSRVALWSSSEPDGRRGELVWVEPGGTSSLTVETGSVVGMRPESGVGPYAVPAAANAVEVSISTAMIFDAPSPARADQEPEKIYGSSTRRIIEELEALLEPDLPLIRVIRRSKRTTLWQEQTALPPHLEHLLPKPLVFVTIDGPREWVVGRPAVFSVRAHIIPPPGVEIVDKKWDPGERFAVLWERPGRDFEVVAALKLKIRYHLKEALPVTITYVYTATHLVNVLALGSPGGDD